jgi:predicted DNA-binding transcriptional regulator YafY
MNRTERFYKIDQMLHERRMVPIKGFLEELDVSRATFKRDIEYIRDRLHAPIVWDRDADGYHFENLKTRGPAYELPGLWFSAGELYALLAAHKLLGILVSHVAPLQARLAALLEASGHSGTEITQRVRLLSMAKRTVESRFSTDITIALLERKRIEIDAWSRGRNETNTRTISPQRLVHYRDNWYIDAWCHLRNDLRSFSVDAIQRSKCYGKKRAIWHRQSSIAISLRPTEYLVAKLRLGRFCGFQQNTPVGCNPSAGTANNGPKCCRWRLSPARTLRRRARVTAGYFTPRPACGSGRARITAPSGGR